jgi:hypothetical protein
MLYNVPRVLSIDIERQTNADLWNYLLSNISCKLHAW